jgi:hypothetical protein
MFGITENGDASINYEWVEKIDEMDGTILITKKITPVFKSKVLEYKNKPIILHISCTGFGGTVLEPRLDNFQTTITHIRDLLNNGFLAERIVLRIDPIIPTGKDIKTFEAVVRFAREVIPEVSRIRISVMDMYPHVRKRFKDNGIECPYADGFQAPDFMFKNLNWKIEELKREFPELSFESCAETKIPAATPAGCVSPKDYQILGLSEPDDSKRGQRKNCLCLGDKKDLLTFKYNKTGYNHCYGCLYCYWQTESDKK